MKEENEKIMKEMRYKIIKPKGNVRERKNGAERRRNKSEERRSLRRMRRGEAGIVHD
jgi:hypothetical protein